MAEPLPAALGWLDSKKHQAIADVAQALQAPETIGPNIWGALQDLVHRAGGQQDTGDPKQNSRNAMMGFGTAPLGIVKFPGPPPIPPRYSVSELEMSAELARKFGLQPEQIEKIKALAAAANDAWGGVK